MYRLSGFLALALVTHAAAAADPLAGWRTGASPLLDDVQQRGAELFKLGNCNKCHEDNGTGGPRGPDLTDNEWLHSDGSVDGIRGVLERGVPREEMKNKRHRLAMAPATRSIPEPADLAILAAYVKSLSANANQPPPPPSPSETPDRVDDDAEDSGADELGDVFHDEKSDYKVRPPRDWIEAPAEGITVPGEFRKAWTPNGQTSIVIFVQPTGVAALPRAILDASVAAMKAQGFEVPKESIGRLGDKRAMNMIVVGDGTGGALTGAGGVRTTQHWVAVPRAQDVLIVLLTCPESEFKTHEKIFRKVARAMEVGGEQTKEQRESK